MTILLPVIQTDRTFTSPVISELVAFVAVTIVPDRCVDTALCASAVVLRTLVLATSAARLILKVGAIRFVVTDF